MPQRQPVFHTGERQHVPMAGSLAPSCGKAARRLRSANLFFRSSPPPCRIGRRRRERSEHGERSEGAVRLCLPRMVTSDERKKVSGGASLHTPLTRRASGGQG